MKEINMFRKFSETFSILKSKVFSILRITRKTVLSVEVGATIGVFINLLIYNQTLHDQKKHDLFQSLLKEQVDSDIKILEIAGKIISIDNKYNNDSIELGQEFTAIYYGRSLFFDSCMFKNSDRNEILRDFKRFRDFLINRLYHKPV